MLYEPGVPDDVRGRLRDYGFQLTERPTDLGNAQAIRVTEDGRYVGVADGRRDGAVVGL